MKEKVRNNILVLTKEKPELKNNYNLLVSEYWKVVEGAKTFEDLRYCTPAESITRAFRKLVQDGEIQVEGKIQQMRFDLADEFKIHYAKK